MDDFDTEESQINTFICFNRYIRTQIIINQFEVEAEQKVSRTETKSMRQRQKQS